MMNIETIGWKGRAPPDYHVILRTSGLCILSIEKGIC